MTMNASSPGLAKLFGNGCAGSAAAAKMPLAARAAVLAADVAQHPHLRRHDVELLADHLGEAFKLDPVMRAGAFGLRELMFDVDPLQGLGQRGAHRARAPMGRDLGAGVGLGLLGRARLGLVEQPELCVGELLRRCPEAPRQQQPYLLVQLLDGRLVACDRRRALLKQHVALDNLGSQRRELFERCGAGRGSHGRESKAFPSAP